MKTKGKWTNKSRVLEINRLRFKLNDNFNGTMAEALRQLADYLETPTEPLPPANWEKVKEAGWTEFLDTVARGGRLLIMGADCFKFLSKDNKWDKMPTGVL